MKPILFNTEMVRAILDGRKTVTRRLVKPQPVKDGRLWRLDGAAWTDNWDSVVPVPCHSLYNKAPFHPGDILYVRETFTEDGGRYYYRADFENDWLEPCETLSGGYPAACRHRNCDACCAEGERIRWHPSIHMPKEAARIFLCVTKVRVERLKAISADECPMEGVWPLFAGPIGCREAFYKTAFSKLWDSTIKPADLPTCGWEADPWVWVIKFERISEEEAMKC